MPLTILEKIILKLTHAFNYFRENNIKVKASCSYAIKWLDNHREYADLMIEKK